MEFRGERVANSNFIASEKRGISFLTSAFRLKNQQFRVKFILLFKSFFGLQNI
jgi:hypothetical protein